MAPQKKPCPTTLAQIGEDGLVRRIAQWARQRPASIPLAKRIGRARPAWAGMELVAGIGDDTAVVRPAPGAPPMAVTTDILIENVHFHPDHPPELLGAKAAAANLSDLAAVGAWPAWILVSFGASRRTSVEWVEALYRGVVGMIEPYGCLCIGGDCSRAERLTINVTAAGNCDPTSSLPFRNRARPGQVLYVTGTLGDSVAGLALLQGRLQTREEKTRRDAARLIARHQSPTPRVEAGVAIARHCPDAAMIDLSDGLSVDLARIAEASGCGFDVRVAALPLSPALKRLAPRMGALPCSGDSPAERTAAQSFALCGGEDYELLFATARPAEEWIEKVSRAAGGRPLRITRIGVAVGAESGVRYLDRRRRPIEILGGGFEHF